MVDRTYVFKLMRAKRLKKLHRRIDAACDAYNHCIALHNRYYGIFGKHLSMYMLQKHLAKILRRSKKRLAALEAEGFEERALFIRPRDAQSETAVATTNKRKEKPKKRRPRRGRLERLRSVVRWETVGSQALQHKQATDEAQRVVLVAYTERIRNGYRLFFDNVRARKAKLTKRRVSPPTFKSKRKYKSFTRKCNAGKSVGWNLPGGNVVRIDGVDFRFHKSREIEGRLKTMTVISRRPTNATKGSKESRRSFSPTCSLSVNATSDGEACRIKRPTGLATLRPSSAYVSETCIYTSCASTTRNRSRSKPERVTPSVSTSV